MYMRTGVSYNVNVMELSVEMMVSIAIMTVEPNQQERGMD